MRGTVNLLTVRHDLFHLKSMVDSISTSTAPASSSFLFQVFIGLEGDFMGGCVGGSGALPLGNVGKGA